MHPVSGAVFPVITDVLLNLPEQVFRIKFPVIQAFHRHLFDQMICIVITGIIKIIVYSRGKHHRHQCQEGKQIANPLFLFIVQIYNN